jgi:hypothetical protein
MFMTSWHSAYTVKEVEALMADAGIDDPDIQTDGAMSFSAHFTKR